MLTLDLIQEEDGSAPEGQDKSFQFDLDRPATSLTPDCPRSKTDGALSATAAGEASVKSQSLPRETAVAWDDKQQSHAHTPQAGKRLTPVEKSRCASMDEILSHSETRTTKLRTPGLPHSPASAPPGHLAPISQLQDLISQKLERTQELLTEVRVVPSEASGEKGKGKAKNSPNGSKGSEVGARAEAERLLKEAASTWGQAKEVLEEVKELRALYRQLDSSSPSGAVASPLTPSHSGKQTQHRKSMM